MRPMLQRPGLVGRAAELALLDEELAAAARGQGRCVIVHGEPGVGKTRLFGEFLAAARRRALTLTARAYPLGTSTPYALISDALEDHLRSLPPAALEDLAGPAPRLAGVLPSLLAISAAPAGDGGRTHVLEDLTGLFRNLSATRPVVLALDDIHLADPSTWEAFHHLALHASTQRLLLLVALRTEALDASPSLADLIGSLVQDWVARELVLAPLDRSAIWDLARRALGRDDIPATVADWLYQKTLGNPLFAMGYLQALVERGEELDPSTLNAVPDTLRRRVAVRVASLSQPGRAALEAAAVIGQRITPGLLSPVAGIPPPDLPPVLAELGSRRLLDEETGSAGVVYEFVHPLVQEAVYESVGGLRRRSLHLAVARTLAAQARGDLAAVHYALGAEAGDQEALAVIVGAAREAESKQAHHEAVAHLQAALALTQDAERRRALLDELAWQAGLAGDFGSGIPALRDLEGMQTDAGDETAHVLTQLRLASLLSSSLGDQGQADAALRQAEALAAASGDRRLQAMALNERSWLVGIGGDLRGQIDAAAAAVGAARELRDREAEMHALGSLGHASIVAGKFDAGAEALGAGLEIARGGPDFAQIGWHASQLGWAQALRGDVEAALLTARALRREIPEAHHAHPLEFEGFGKWLGGRWVEAAADCLRMAGSWSPAGFTSREVWTLATAIICLAEMGRASEAAAVAARVRRRNLADFYWMTPWYRHSLGVLDLAEDRPEAAAEAFQDAARALVSVGAFALAPLSWLELAAVAGRLHDLDRVAEASAALDGCAERLEPAWYQGLAHLARVELCEARGSVAEALAAAQAACLALAPSQLKFFAARALEARGRLAGAAEDLAAALAIYRELPAPSRAEAVMRLLEGLGAEGRRVAARARGPASLSPRERAVAVLAARGMTAREIAQRLFIGERTVESHLASAYAKLGLASKRELMSRARELELSDG